jgi:hypothetical protein
VRTVDLGRTAAQAEILRLKRLVRRQITRVVWGVVAAAFLIAVLVMVHVVLFALLNLVLPPIWSTVVLLAFDAVLAGLFLVLAFRGSPDTLEIEAATIRDQALLEMRESLAIGAILSPVTRLAFRSAGRKNMWGMTLAALTAQFLSKNRR